MKRFVKMTGIALMVAGSLGIIGCGDEKKPEPQKPATSTTTTTTTKTTTTTPVAPEEKLSAGPNWRYPGYIKKQSETPKVTPEIQKIVDECFAQSKLHPSEKGMFLNDSKINPSDKRNVRNLWFHAKGENQDVKMEKNIKNSKGVMVYQQESYHIKMTVDKDTSAVKNWEFSKFELNASSPDGKKTIIKKVNL